MSDVVHPILFYLAIALGGVGVWLAMPRRGANPQILGGILAASAFGLGILLLSLRAGIEHLPNLYFYVFGAVALLGAIRVITHPKPVYAALFFVLTVLATAGLFVILSAEFLAFALIIVYAGAILITYLFVIMLATQAPVEGIEDEVVPEYDRLAREPFAAVASGFVLLAVLTTLMFRGVPTLVPQHSVADQRLLAILPGKIEQSLREGRILQPGEKIEINETTGKMAVDLEAGTIRIINSKGETRTLMREQWPAELNVRNVEGVAWDLLANHPGSIEIAGVVLLMAMLGAVVLARKQVQLDEDAKARHAEMLSGKSDAEGIA